MMASCAWLSDFSVHRVPPAVDAPFRGFAEEEELRDVISRYCEKQLQR